MLSDQDRISPYNIKQTSDEKEKYQLGDYQLTWYQILPTNIIRIVWQSVRRITNEILRVKGLQVRGSTKYAFYACRSKKRYISFDKNWS